MEILVRKVGKLLSFVGKTRQTIKEAALLLGIIALWDGLWLLFQ